LGGLVGAGLAVAQAQIVVQTAQAQRNSGRHAHAVHRRAPVDVDIDTLPRLILRGEEWQADETEEPGLTHYRLAFSVTGFASAATDLAAEQALSLLHAHLVQTLAGWTPSTPGLGDIAEQGAEFSLYDSDASAQPAGEFLARFSMLAIGPSGGPWAS
jgi:hypothetical protein